MSGRVIDGKEIARRIRSEIATEAELFQARFGRRPGLAVILVGQNPASETYVRSKERAATAAGFHSRVLRLPDTVDSSRLLEEIEGLNRDERVDGLLVQLPLPAAIAPERVWEAVRPEKDVDGFHPQNAGRLFQGRESLVPCTPLGVMELLQREEIPVAGKRAVVVGRSTIVGRPMAQLLLDAHATVTIAHSRTPDLASVCREADILVAAVGRPGLIGEAHIQRGAVVIDVGINRVGERLVGDVDAGAMERLASAYTPVPGGVGPMTIAMLLRNTLTAARNRLAP